MCKEDIDVSLREVEYVESLLSKKKTVEKHLMLPPVNAPRKKHTKK